MRLDLKDFSKTESVMLHGSEFHMRGVIEVKEDLCTWDKVNFHTGNLCNVIDQRLQLWLIVSRRPERYSGAMTFLHL